MEMVKYIILNSRQWEKIVFQSWLKQLLNAKDPVFQRLPITMKTGR